MTTASGTVAISAEHRPLHTENGTIEAYFAAPENASPNTPGVVVVMHVWGVDTPMRDAAHRLAEAGFATIAPDLYSRFGAPDGDGVTDHTIFRPFAAKLNRRQYGSDLHAAAGELLSTRPDAKVGILGFCMGGRMALEQLVDDPTVYFAAAPFYGAVKDIDPAAVHTPVVGSYGEHDTSIPADDVRAFAKALRVPNDIHIYPDAGHAFCDQTRSAYRAADAADAWQRTIAFLAQHLAGAR